MNSQTTRPALDEVLGGLKDFQRDSVEYIFRRLYKDQDCTRRFLLADEVGLGKTLVARGVIARAIDHLWDKIERIDIVYICSNADIARQNINRLKTNDQEDFALASRITLLPTQIQNLKNNKLNFISFTPGTSFELKSNIGTIGERALLYWLFEQVWTLRGTGPLNRFQGEAGKERFRTVVSSYKDNHDIDNSLAADFAKALEGRVVHDRREGKKDIRTRFEELCQRFSYARKHVPAEDRADRAAMVGELRELLATTCLTALEPDLIILDEFQRFKNLLNGTDQASGLAKGLFEYQDARVLLLSATPYKMYTMAQEAADDDHYADFLQTFAFLQADEAENARFGQLLAEYRRELIRLDQGGERLLDLKHELETRLRKVMVRTERLAVTEDRNGMLVQMPTDTVRLEPDDLQTYASLQKVGRLLKQDDIIEYWKSAPYLLNFMDGYELKKAFAEGCKEPEQMAAIADALSSCSHGLLNWSNIAAYEKVDPGNSRLRALAADTIDKGAWRLLWIPPALPYYELGDPFAAEETGRFTKRLVFSSWRVVPKALAALLSYEAERRLVRSFEPNAENTPAARRKLAPLLRFAFSEGRYSGMPVLGLLYPSTTLARECDPLALAAEEGRGRLMTAEEIVKHAEHRVDKLLAKLGTRGSKSGPVDEAWYWAAPLLLDLHFDEAETRSWFARPDLAAKWSGETDLRDKDGQDSLWSAHVEQARELLDGNVLLGPQPPDLALVLAQMAVAGPGVTALRALSRVCGGLSAGLMIPVRDGAARVASAFRTLFNLPEVIALLRGLNTEEPYWQRVIEYCLAGGLQSTLDEYAHVLRESLGLLTKSPEIVANEISTAVREALMLRTATLGFDELIVDRDCKKAGIGESRHLRVRFAARFGQVAQEQGDDGKGGNRSEQVRAAFNSPFWPFVLATTSVGQEGLDFHPYCHAVVHWNLPANPVDLEQREGRVHRYKGHAVRRNLAWRYGDVARAYTCSDPWELVFAMGKQDRDAEATDLVPYWVYPLENGAKIERHVPILPLSRDSERLEALRRSLSVYRLVFGQPRQEDLLAYLITRLPEGEIHRVMEQLRIDLSPPPARLEAKTTTAPKS